MNLEVKRISPETAIPKHAKPGDAGIDLSVSENIDIREGETVIVGTGLSFAIPDGMYGMLAPRSGFASKYGVTLANAPSIIDSGYRGEVKLALYRNYGPNDGKNHSPLHIKKGTRVAQIVVMPFVTCECVEVDELGETERGASGFGSSGTGELPVTDVR